MHATITIEPREAYFSFSFQSEDRQVILFSRLFRTKKLCEAGIIELIRIVDTAGAVEKLEGRGGEYSFVVRNARNVTLGHSAVFYGASTRDYALRKLQRQAALAEIIDAQASTRPSVR